MLKSTDVQSTRVPLKRILPEIAASRNIVHKTMSDFCNSNSFGDMVLPNFAFALVT
jgi:hypothetical protein